MGEHRRANRTFIVLTLATLALVPLGYVLLLRDAPIEKPILPRAPLRPVALAVPAAIVPPVDPARALDDLRLTEVTGKVEVRRGAGTFEAVSVGAILRPDDALRVGDGRAKLAAGGFYELDAEPGTALEVRELTSTLSRFLLENGMLVASQAGGDRTLEVAAAGTDAVARTRNGAFAMSNNGAGTVAVGARAGEVELTAAGRAVILRAGEQSFVHSPGPPSQPEPIPKSLFLKIAWPETARVKDSRLELAGRAAPGAHLVLAGKTLKLAGDGRFTATLTLHEGENSLLVEGLDVGGNRVKQRRKVTVDSTAPDLDVKTEGMWDK